MRAVTSRGVTAAIVAGLAFGSSGVLVKPLLLGGWSPAAAATVRTLLGAAVLAPLAVTALRGHWGALRAAWRRVLAMGLVGSAATQLAYFAAVERIPVGTAVLVEYLAPVALVLWVAARTRSVPKAAVLVGAGVAVAGLLLVIGRGALGHLDPLGLTFALLAMVGCAIYFVVAADVSDGLPPVALAAAGLLVGGVAIAIVGAVGILPMQASLTPVRLGGGEVPVLGLLLVLGVVPTAVAYASSIAATELLGARVSSFFGLLEVVTATGYAWVLLGEPVSVAQGLGGALILGGIVLVRAEPSAVPELEPLTTASSGGREDEDRPAAVAVIGQ